MPNGVETADLIVYSILGLLAIVSLFVYFKLKRPLTCLTFTGVSGLLTLVIVNFLSAFTHVALTINLFTIGISAILGVPGIVSMLFLRLIWAG